MYEASAGQELRAGCMQVPWHHDASRARKKVLIKDIWCAGCKRNHLEYSIVGTRIDLLVTALLVVTALL